MDTIHHTTRGAMQILSWKQACKMKSILWYTINLALCLVLCVACTTDMSQVAPASSIPIAAAVASPGTRSMVSPVQGHQTTPATNSQQVTSALQPPTTAESTIVAALLQTPVPLAGPLALLVIETTQQLENYVSILDLGTGSLHPLDIQEERLTALQWFGDGCEVYLNGDVYNLSGDIIWQVPSSVKAKTGNLNTAQLSPGKGWLAYPVFSGSQTLDSSEFVDVDAVSMMPPFPSYRLTQHGGAEYESIVWSHDDKWMYYSDYDGNGVLQIFRATPDGRSREQLTNHKSGFGRVNSMALSPDGTQLAYGIVNLLATSSPYSYVETDEGWVGIVDLDTLSVTEVNLPKFGSAFSEGGLWWNQGSDELLVFGTSLPVSPTDPFRGKQIHWIRIDEDGVPFRSIYETAIPGNSIAWMMPISDLDTLFLRTQRGLFLFQEDTFSPYNAPELLNSIEANGRIIDFIPGRIGFPGEMSCRDERETPAAPVPTPWRTSRP